MLTFNFIAQLVLLCFWSLSASSDGRVFVRKIVEGPDEEDILQITDQVLLGMQFIGDWESVQPRICWLCQTQVYYLERSYHVTSLLIFQMCYGSKDACSSTCTIS